jgi:hypothetical protein
MVLAMTFENEPAAQDRQLNPGRLANEPIEQLWHVWLAIVCFGTKRTPMPTAAGSAFGE